MSAAEPQTEPSRAPLPGCVECRSSAIHGRGAFAARRIPAGACVLEYVGERVTKEESLRRCEAGNEYIFSINDREDLDGKVEWNPARLINHSCAPNCEAELDEGRIWIVSLRDIAPGEELTFNYGYDLVDYREHPCRCGAEGCVGYMVGEQFFEHVRQQRLHAEPAWPASPAHKNAAGSPAPAADLPSVVTR